MFRVIIAGGRDFNDYETLKKFVNSMLINQKDKIQIVCGDANGADKLGAKYALEYGYDVAHYPADWDNDGRAAGYKRNVKMAENADALIAFWDGKSKGTKHMIDITKAYKLPLRVKRY